MDYNDVNTIRRLAGQLGVTFKSADFNVLRDGDIQFVYDGMEPVYYRSAESGLDREISRLRNFIKVASEI